MNWILQFPLYICWCNCFVLLAFDGFCTLVWRWWWTTWYTRGRKLVGWCCFVDILQTSMALSMVLKTFCSYIQNWFRRSLSCSCRIAQIGSLGFCHKIAPSLGVPSKFTDHEECLHGCLTACLIKVTSTSLAPNLQVLSALQSSATVRSEPTGFDPLPFGLRGSGTLLQNASDTEMNADHMMSQEKL